MGKSTRFLKYLADLTLAQMKHLTRNLTREDMIQIRELIYNILIGKVTVDKETLHKLSPYKKFLRNLAYKGLKRCEMNKYCNVLLQVLKIARPVLKLL